jgi:hypothetical protein
MVSFVARDLSKVKKRRCGGAPVTHARERAKHPPIFPSFPLRPPARAYWGRAEADEVIAAILTRFALPAEKARRRDLARRAENAARFEATCATKVVS